MTLQRQMVAIAILAILLVGGIVVGPDVCRRWINCRDRARSHAKSAVFYRREAASGDNLGAVLFVEYEEAKSMEYQRALWLPWEFYTLGD